ncbi:SRPBCC domain-containing protein [Paenibacillus sp. LMG 31456]|uniref:SRPBCC domain-containing protein n=1 Tax=Paenibacillus foliorum TaxID=2654974 RepID=A0A972JZ62_9BACL|nr:SRPBCC domain-containing protein [Paenibacillus foliorum]NOU94239.1 SRPBCC domain-containing protein [Paenibacillus foliorum]
MINQEPKPVGLTASVGYQIGVRRPLPISKERAWELISSLDGLQLWLGSISSMKLQRGEKYLTEEGTSGELRVVKPYEQLRLTWHKAGWSQPSTLQIRLISTSPIKTTLSFHQEKLENAAVREEMKARWEHVIMQISESSV